MDAIDQILELRVGQDFTLRGRTLSRSRYGGSFADGYCVVPCWNEQGREVKIKVRATDRIGGVAPIDLPETVAQAMSEIRSAVTS